MIGYDRQTSLPKAWIKSRLRPNDATKELIRQMFSEDLENYYDNKYTEWDRNHDGRLAIILLTDQLAKTLCKPKEMFKISEKACSVAKKIMSTPPLKRKYKAAERLFII